MRTDKILLFFISVICSFGAAGSTGDARGEVTSRVGSALIVHDALTGQGNHASEVFKILSVLKGRIEDPKLIQKVEDKLSTLREDRLHMVVSLSERITDGDRGVETDIAFFLLTTLIIFS